MPRTLLISALLCTLTGCCTDQQREQGRLAREGASLGNFSVSLAVKDLAASRAFYEKLGFRALSGPAGGDGTRYVILQNQTATIGLFQGVIPNNTLSFNPGWDRAAQPLARFDDVRDIQAALIARGLTPTMKADPNSTGPAFLMLTDPDGNPVLIDQHVPRPR
jgi:catechol 2,3-dioxygenase-like lactoylglutathione lyase family enzyme